VSKDSDRVDIRAHLHCKSCGSSKLLVGLSTDDELVIACGSCNLVVLLVDKWPNPAVSQIKCPMCEAGKCDKDHLN
jgi:hypothetical protein